MKKLWNRLLLVLLVLAAALLLFSGPAALLGLLSGFYAVRLPGAGLLLLLVVVAGLALEFRPGVHPLVLFEQGLKDAELEKEIPKR